MASPPPTAPVVYLAVRQVGREKRGSYGQESDMWGMGVSAPNTYTHARARARTHARTHAHTALKVAA